MNFIKPKTDIMKWKYCNTKLIIEKDYCQEYKCPKCGSTSGLVNIFGLCATKITVKQKSQPKKETFNYLDDCDDEIFDPNTLNS